MTPKKMFQRKEAEENAKKLMEFEAKLRKMLRSPKMRIVWVKEDGEA